MKKVFKDVGKTAYYATEDGEIWSLRKSDGRWLKLKLGKNLNGYLFFRSCQNGVAKNISVHRAVWEAYNGPIPEGLEINHLNTVRTDNRLENLELVTSSQNHLHPPTRARQREAKRHKMKPCRDLSTGVVYESTMEAARQTGLNQSNISAVCRGLCSQTGGRTFEFV